MNCVELQESLAEVEGSAEQNAHLSGCPVCSVLVNDLDLIATTARELQAADEPSPRVWNSIEIALRQEGLIRPQIASRPPAESFSARWGAARWLVPAAAMLLLSLGIYVHREPLTSRESQEASVAVPGVNSSGLIDEELMQEVSLNAPAMRSQYEENLRRVNEAIRDAQGLVENSPNDEDARRSLMNAYQQKSMLFEMAMDRSMP